MFIKVKTFAVVLIVILFSLSCKDEKAEALERMNKAAADQKAANDAFIKAMKKGAEDKKNQEKMKELWK